MARDLTNQQTQRQDTDSKTSYDAKEQARRKRFGNAPKKINPEDQPWVLTNKSNEKASKQLILTVFTQTVFIIIIINHIFNILDT
jgi:hypothetical protein